MFEHLKKLDTRGREADLVMPDLDLGGDLDGPPTLRVKPATESNRQYFAARLKSLQASRRTASRKVSQADVEAAREADRGLYPRHVVVGWSNVLNSRGEPAEFSMANCEALLRAMPEWMFDEVRNFCSDPSNFLPSDKLDGEEVEDLGNA